MAISSLGAGGAERVMSRLADELAALSHEVHLVTYSAPGDDFFKLSSAVRRVSLGIVGRGSYPGAGLIANLWRIARWREAVASIAPDVIISFITETNVLVLLATYFARTPVIVSERVDPRSLVAARGWRALRRRLYPRARLLVVQTTEVLGWWRAELGGRLAIAVIANPVDLPTRPAPLPDTAGARRYILAAGRLVPQKGFDLLVSAFRSVADAYPELDLVIAGEGPLQASLQAQAAAQGLDGRLRLLGRVADLQPWMANAELFVLASRFEGFPNVLLEALASGVAAIATTCASGPAEICAGGAALLVPPENEGELSAAMLRLLGDAALRADLKQRARAAAERFATPRIATEWDRTLRGVVPE